MAFLIPDSVVVGASQSQDVGAAGEIGIAPKAPGAGLDPFGIEAFQKISIPVLFRTGKAERCKLELEKVARPVKAHFRQAFDRFAGIDTLATLGQRGQHNRWDGWVIPHLVRKESIEAIHAAKKHLTTGAFVVRALVEFAALQPVANIVVSKRLRLQVEPGQTSVGTEPEVGPALLGREVVLQYPIHRVVRQAVVLRIVPKGPCRPVKPVQAATTGCQPEHTLLVLMDGQNRVVAQALRISGIVLIMDKLLPIPIEAVEPTVERANPEHTIRILVNG